MAVEEQEIGSSTSASLSFKLSSKAATKVAKSSKAFVQDLNKESNEDKDYIVVAEEKELIRYRKKFIKILKASIVKLKISVRHCSRLGHSIPYRLRMLQMYPDGDI